MCFCNNKEELHSSPFPYSFHLPYKHYVLNNQTSFQLISRDIPSCFIKNSPHMLHRHLNEYYPFRNKCKSSQSLISGSSYLPHSISKLQLFFHFGYFFEIYALVKFHNFLILFASKPGKLLTMSQNWRVLKRFLKLGYWWSKAWYERTIGSQGVCFGNETRKCKRHLNTWR